MTESVRAVTMCDVQMPTVEELRAIRERMCGRDTMGRTWPFLKTCIRPKHHAGRCKGIEDGMTARQALSISDPDD